MVTRLLAKGAETRRRILDAATVEFAAHGIAGARVDRIVAAARTNKAQMYAYFGNKDGLFDAVFAEHLERMLDSVPIDGTDLPGYAVALYDAHLVHPELIRLVTWTRLERTPTGDLFPGDHEPDAAKLVSIADAQRAGRIDPEMTPLDVLSIVIAMSMTWSPASAMITADAGEDTEVHTRRRRALAVAVQRAFRP